MHRAVILLTVVASVVALPVLNFKDASCLGAENVAQCEADIAVCKDVFASGPFDGPVTPERILEDLSVELEVIRPDLLQRILNTAETCPLDDVDEWATCTLSACGYQDQSMEAPTTLAPKE